MFEDNPMCSDILSLHCREPVSQTASDLDSDPEHNKCEFTGIDSSMERGERREQRGRERKSRTFLWQQHVFVHSNKTI